MSDDKTEEPTPKRLREARARGQVAKSRELGTAALLLTAGTGLGALAPDWVASFRALLEPALAAARGETSLGPGAALELAVTRFGTDALPLLAVFAVAAGLASFVQVGPLVALDALAFSPERLDPIEGAKRLFGRDAWIELARSLLKVVVVAWVVRGVLLDGLHGSIGLAGQGIGVVLGALGTLVHTLLFRAGGAMLAIAIADVLYQRWKMNRELRMTKEEVKREHKESEGDPHAKGERERVRREIAQHDMAEAVRRADVVVVNPTHLAIALRFDEEGEAVAPEVVARGQDEVAQRIRAIAEEAGVPIVRDVPLAHGLFALELGAEIPEALYEAVAAVLSAAWAEKAREEGSS